MKVALSKKLVVLLTLILAQWVILAHARPAHARAQGFRRLGLISLVANLPLARGYFVNPWGFGRYYYPAGLYAAPVIVPTTTTFSATNGSFVIIQSGYRF